MSAIPLQSKSPLWPLRYISLLDPEPIRVLLAGDDEELRDRVAAALRGDGHVVVEAIEGAAAPPGASEGRPDILVGAVRTPDRTHLVSAVRTPGRTHLQGLAPRHGGDPHLPVVLITTSADERVQLAAYRSGADVVLGAGTDLDELLISVRALVPDKG